MKFTEADWALLNRLYDDPDYQMSVNERWAFTRKIANYAAWLESELDATKNLCAELDQMVARLVAGSRPEQLTVRDR